MAWRMITVFLLGIGVLGGCDGTGDASATGSDLSSSARDGLVFVREEEKLARDVYAALEEHDSTFATIGDSEQSHMDAVGKLLERYGVPDPAAGVEPGRFENPDLQTLHDGLVARGMTSRVAALAVGVEIEELDIVDIEGWKVGVTEKDVLQTYDNLTRGSRNHLRAFHGALVDAGGTYVPKHLDGETFEGIVSSPVESGR